MSVISLASPCEIDGPRVSPVTSSRERAFWGTHSLRDSQGQTTVIGKHNKCFMLMHRNDENSVVNEAIVLEWVFSSNL